MASILEQMKEIIQYLKSSPDWIDKILASVEAVKDQVCINSIKVSIILNFKFHIQI